MRRLFWLLALISIPLFTSSSLLHSIQNCPANLSGDAFQDGIQLYECGDTTGAIEQLNVALDQTQDPVSRADIQVVLGQALLDSGDALNAQTQFERAFLAYNNASDSQNSGVAYYYAGLAKLARQLPDDALRYFYSGVQQSTRAADNENLAKLHLVIGDLLYDNNDFAKAEEEYQKALEAQQLLNDKAGQVTTWYLLGDAAIAQGEVITATDYYSNSLALGLEIHADADVAYVQYRLGIFAIDQGKFVEGETKLLSARDGFTALDDQIGALRAIIELGRAYIFIGDYRQASTFLTTSLQLARDLDDCESTLSAQNYFGFYNVAQGNYGLANEYFSTVLLTPCVEDHLRLKAQAFHGRGITKINSGLYILGGDDYQFALKIYRDIKDRNGEREVLISLGDLNVVYRNWKMASDYYATAMDLAQQTGNQSGEVEVLLARARLDMAQRFYDQAILKFQDALTIALETENVVAQAKALDGIANLYFTQARYDEALSFYEQVSQTVAASSNRTYEARVLYNRGLIYENQGEFELAETFYDRARGIFEDIGETQNVMQVDISLGLLYQRLSQYEQALEIFKQVLANAQKSDNSKYVAAGFIYVADLELQLWDQASAGTISLNEQEQTRVYDRVERNYRSALNLYIELADENGQAETLYRLGLLGLRRPIAANFGTGGFFNSALALARSNRNPLLECNILNGLGDFYTVTGESGTALTYYSDAERIAKNLDPVLALRIKVKKAALHERRGEVSQAIQVYEESIEQIEQIYASISSEQERIIFGEQSLYLQPYERLIRYYGLNIVYGRDKDAAITLNYAERSRARSYLFQLGEQNVNFGEGEEAQKINDWVTTSKQLIDLTRQLTTTQGDANAITALNEQIAETEAHLLEIEQSIEVSSLRQFIGINVASLEEIQDVLPEDTAMVAYYVSPETRTEFRDEAGRIFIWVITKDSITLVPQYLESFDDLRTKINAFLTVPSNTVPLEQLYQLLIQPIETNISGYKDVVFIPHGILNYLPFEALTDDDGTTLLGKHTIMYSPSATVYVLLKNQMVQTAVQDNSLVLAFGDDLFYAPDEAELVGEMLGVAPLVDQNATETAFRQQSAMVDIIHIAAHGIFNARNPLESYVALAPDDTNDGNLQVQEIYELSFQQHHPLIVLSACQTAVSQVNPGDEVQGMTRAFLLTGARGIIASLWSVDDVATSELMTLFYENRAQGMDNATALAEAKRKLQETYPSPYYWAPFILIGTEQ